MKKLLVLFFAILLAACDSVNTEKVAAVVEKSFGDEGIAAPVVAPKNIYVILDGSGSGSSKYAIPKLNITDIETLVEKLSQHGGGHLYLNFVDKDGDNNAISHVKVPGYPVKPTIRPKYTGEQAYQYQVLEKEYAKTLANYEASYKEVTRQVESIKSTYLDKWEAYLDNAYAPKGADDYSDAIGVLNSAYRSLGSTEANTENFVLAISDLEHDVPTAAAQKTLSSKPAGVKLIRINASDSGKKVTETDHEMDSFDNALDLIFNRK